MQIAFDKKCFCVNVYLKKSQIVFRYLLKKILVMMNILIIDSDDMVRRNLPLAFRKYFPGAFIKTAHNLKSTEIALKASIFDIVFIDMDMKDVSEKVSDYDYVAGVVKNVLFSSSGNAEVAMLGHKVPTDPSLPWGVKKWLNKNRIFASPMAVNQITPELTVEPLSYQYSF